VVGRYDEALESVLRARDTDPLALWARSALVDFYYKLRDFDGALEVVQLLLEITPDDAVWLAYAGQLYAEKQEPLKALSYAKKAVGLTGGDPNIELSVALIYATLGDQFEARKILQQIDLESATQLVSPGYLASVYANLGENDLAMASLVRAVDEYDSWIFNLDYRMWDPLRSDPRFIRLCEYLKMACAKIPSLKENR
jgi:predicted Zn-dependent protease